MVSVRDDSPLPPSDAGRASRHPTGGALVGSLAVPWRVDETAGGKDVWSELDLAADPLASEAYLHDDLLAELASLELPGE